MPKIIFTSRYLRDTPPEQLENYVRYIGTREGVEKNDASKRHLPATIHQKEFIKQLIRNIPQAKEMLEYADFLLHPTIGNASELISCALEQHLDLVAKRENYVDYISSRPRVERIGEHGLFTDAGKAVVLHHVQEEVMHHKGVVWTHVISLRREDAARLGYDSAEQWMALLRSKRAMLCRHMKIDSANLRWYAAFHNESHHPHVHLMVYSAKDKDGYLTKQSIEAMRSELAHDIFRQDFAHIYEEQNQVRGNLKSQAEEIMQQMTDALRSGTTVNPVIEKKILQLSKRLQNTGGKKVYGYLKRDVKSLIDEIVDELAKDSRVDALYQAWGKWQNEILLTYQNQGTSLPSLSQQKVFKSIKNMVIVEAMQIADQNFTFEDEVMEELAKEPEMIPEDTMPSMSDVPEQYKAYPEPSNCKDDGIEWWSKEYKQARKYLYGDDSATQDFAEAFHLFRQEAEKCNGFAMHDLGRMCADGLGCEMNLELSQEWYIKALSEFYAAEQHIQQRQRPYLWYRIGKMYAAGLGTERNYEIASEWFSQAAAADHKYAQYSLAGLYYRGQGVEQSYEQAFRLYRRSAEQGNPYANYEVAKMYRDGIGIQMQPEQAEQFFRSAFYGFTSLEKQSHDDKLQYRLGQMLHTGIGTERDEKAAAEYWEKAAKLGNVHAQYALGKLYLCGEDVRRDIEKALDYLKASAEKNHEYASYQLGKLYLTGEVVPKEVKAAVRYLEVSAGNGNQFAQYALGKLYLQGKDVPRDKEKAVHYLEESAAQGNLYAKFLLEHLDSFRDPSPFLAATRLLHRLESLFREDYHKTTGGSTYSIDRKRRRKLAEKKQAQGHKRDDHEPIRQIY